jgi:hypothetical protein
MMNVLTRNGFVKVMMLHKTAGLLGVRRGAGKGSGGEKLTSALKEPNFPEERMK